MKNLTRRQFLTAGALGMGAVVAARTSGFEAASKAFAIPAKMPIGFQTWSVKDLLAKDLPGTLKMMADMGYQSLEMCSPPGYVDSGFAPLMKYSAKELLKIINDHGLAWLSTHYGMDELRKNLDARMQFALDSGQKQMIVSSFGLPENAKLRDWLSAANEMNAMGEKTLKEGIQLGYHNHDMEFATLDGMLIYDELMKEFDPRQVKMQFQVAVIRLGYKAADYFKKYPGRFISAHLADWSVKENKQVPMGQGVVDWKEFFATLGTGGVQNIFVEMDLPNLKDSVAYLKKI